MVWNNMHCEVFLKSEKNSYYGKSVAAVLNAINSQHCPNIKLLCFIRECMSSVNSSSCININRRFEIKKRMINAMKLYNIKFLGQGKVLAESHWYLSFLVRGTIFKLNCLERVPIFFFLQDIHTAQNTSCFLLLLFHSTQSLLDVHHMGQLPFTYLYHQMLGGAGSFIGKKDFYTAQTEEL